MGSYPYTQVSGHLSFKFIFKAKLQLESGTPKNPIWPPGSHFESDIAENQQITAYGYHQHSYEIWNWNSKANLTYAPETMPPTESRNWKSQYGHQAAIF